MSSSATPDHHRARTVRDDVPGKADRQLAGSAGHLFVRRADGEHPGYVSWAQRGGRRRPSPGPAFPPPEASECRMQGSRSAREGRLCRRSPPRGRHRQANGLEIRAEQVRPRRRTDARAVTKPGLALSRQPRAAPPQEPWLLLFGRVARVCPRTARCRPLGSSGAAPVRCRSRREAPLPRGVPLFRSATERRPDPACRERPLSREGICESGWDGCRRRLTHKLSAGLV
jgi:hypothetical protein